MNDKIAIILTGGTISAVLTENATKIDVASTAALQSQMQTLLHHPGVACDFYPLLAKDSAVFDVAEWHAIAVQVDTLIAKGYKRFLVTHGTDTLPFTATLLHLLFGRRGVSIVLGAAFYSLTYPRSDAIPNLNAAMALLAHAELHTGVYIPFRGMGHNVQLHHAMNLKQMLADAESFDSFYGNAAGIYTDGAGLKWTGQYPKTITVDFAIPNASALQAATRRVHFLGAYPGMNLTPFHALAQKEDVLLVIRNYHSGTANSTDVAGGVTEFIRTHPNSLVAFSPFPSALVSKPYESTFALMHVGAHFYCDLPTHKLYVLGLLGLAHGLSPRDALRPAKDWLLNHRA